MLDYYLNLADATAGKPPAFQSRFAADGSIWLWEYENTRSPSQVQRLIGRIKDGHISVPLNVLVPVYGGTPTEGVLRSMYYSGQAERRYGLRFSLAVAMEKETLPYGLPALWAGSGAKYSWKGVCTCYSKVQNLDDRDHEIYWAVGPDGSKVLMKWHSYVNRTSLSDGRFLGGYAEARDLAAAVDFVETNANFKARYPYDVIGIFGKGWDDLKTMTSEFVTVAQQKTNATRTVIVSNEEDFFKDFEATYGATLPSMGVAFGNEREVHTASLAELSGRVRRAIEGLRSAEALATLVSLTDPGFMQSRTAQRDRAWMNLAFYYDHDWNANGPLPPPLRQDWQYRVAQEFEAYVAKLQADAASALAAKIHHPGSNVRFFAFNPLGWSRTDVADIPYAATGAVHVVDLTTGQEVPSQRVVVGGQARLRVLASNVPPVGYKVFEVVPGPGQIVGDAATVTGGVIENSLYRVAVAPRGAIVSLVDKARGNREFVKAINGLALNDLGPSSSGALAVENAGPVSVTLRATAADPLQHTSRVTLIRGLARIDVHNEITENFGQTYTWTNSLNLTAPEVWHEEVGAVIRARLISQGGQYAERNARYDWLTLNHFVDMSGGGVGLTLSSADTPFMRLGGSTPSTLDVNTPQVRVLVGGQVDGPTLGFPNQGGDSYFLQRFALTTHGAFDATQAMKFALEHQNPLAARVITGGTTFPEAVFSLLRISDPNVLLWALKPAEEGIAQGVIARMWNVASRPISARLEWSGPLAAARRTTHLETDLGPAPVSGAALPATFATQQIQTYRLFPSGSTGSLGAAPDVAPASLPGDGPRRLAAREGGR
jgi:alpha-mannosidase